MKKYFKVLCVLIALTFIISPNFAKAESNDDMIASGAIVGLAKAIGEFDFDNAPELTVKEITLKPGEKYDLDVNNKIAESKYKYQAFGTKVATVSPYKGIIKAKSEGITTIYCTVTLPDGTAGMLKCKVTVTK